MPDARWTFLHVDRIRGGSNPETTIRIVSETLPAALSEEIYLNREKPAADGSARGWLIPRGNDRGRFHQQENGALRGAGAVEHAAGHGDSLLGGERHDPVLGQVDEKPALDDVKKLVLPVVFVPSEQSALSCGCVVIEIDTMTGRRRS